METAVLIPSPSPAPEFNFESASTSPFITAPSTPSFFTTTTPLFDDDFEFDFDFSRTLHRPSSIPHADDLFSGGQIKPLKPPPRVQSPANILFKAVSPKVKKKEFDPFEEGIKQSQREKQGNVPKEGRERGRERKPGNRTRSLSPLRVSDLLSENDPDSPKMKTEKLSTLFSYPKSVWKRYKNWKLKDLLLFRSTSEGRKDEIRDDSVQNYSLTRKNLEEGVKNSSFRSTESSGSVSGSGSGSGRRRKASLSSHEKHYKMNRAAQEEMKKKTPLPYKHGLMGMGCLGLESTVHDLGRGFGSIRG